MKSVFVVALLAAASVPTIAEAQKAPSAKVGALAIDRHNGFAYGFAFDHATRAEAEARALEEVTKRGGNGTVVLVWSGEGCGAYRTIDPKDGNAYGWGVAPTQAAAEAIADKEVDKRANGKSAADRIWACNSKSPAKLKVLKDMNNENFRTVTIAGQTWTAENAVIAKFRNGDPIPKLPNYDAFWKVSIERKPASYCYATDPDCTKYGRFYNFWAIVDPRGFAPEGWSVPSEQQYQQLFDALGGKYQAVGRLRAAAGWPEWADPGEPSGFDALSTGDGGNKPDFRSAYFWTRDSVVDDGPDAGRYTDPVTAHIALLAATGEADEARIDPRDPRTPLTVRLIAN